MAQPVWKFLISPTGNLLVTIAGFVWLAAVVFWPRKASERGGSSSPPEKTWADAMVEDDAAKIQERIKTAKQRIQFHYSPGSDPYVEVITELWNGSVFELVSFGEISGHTKYAEKQLASEPRVIDSLEPIFLTMKHGEGVTLTVRQYVSTDVADTMVAYKDRPVAVDFQSVAVSFKVSPRGPGLPNQQYKWWGPRFTMQDAERI
jgi:hypothetical protein